MSAKRNTDNMAAIRQAVTMHRGGWTNASDEEIRRLWHLLPPEVREEYLANAAQRAAEAQATPATAKARRTAS